MCYKRYKAVFALKEGLVLDCSLGSLHNYPQIAKGFDMVIMSNVFFLSHYENKLDAKGRVSVPSNFRDNLKHEEFSGVVLLASIVNNCIEGYAYSKIRQIADQIEATCDPLSDERDAFATMFLGLSFQLNFDTEGRIVLPQQLIKHANLTEKVVFVGKGSKFEIWNPEQFAKHAEQSKQSAKDKKSALVLQKQ